jgi:hypothetical protein
VIDKNDLPVSVAAPSIMRMTPVILFLVSTRVRERTDLSWHLRLLWMIKVASLTVRYVSFQHAALDRHDAFEMLTEESKNVLSIPHSNLNRRMRTCFVLSRMKRIPTNCSCGQVAAEGEYGAHASCCARITELVFTLQKNDDLEVRAVLCCCFIVRKSLTTTVLLSPSVADSCRRTCDGHLSSHHRHINY